MILGWHCPSRPIHIHSGNINVHLPTRSTHVMGWQVSSSQLTWAMSNHFNFHHVSMIFDRLPILSVLFCIVLFYVFHNSICWFVIFFVMMIWLKSTNRHHVVAARHVRCRWPGDIGKTHRHHVVSCCFGPHVFFLASSTHLSNYSLIPKLHGRMMLSRLLRVWKMAIEIVSFPMKHSGFP